MQQDGWSEELFPAKEGALSGGYRTKRRCKEKITYFWSAPRS